MNHPPLRFRVHGMNEVPRGRLVVFEGQEVRATMHALDVELSWDDKQGRDHGSLKLSFMGADEVNWARSVFETDREIDLTFSKVEPALVE